MLTSYRIVFGCSLVVACSGDPHVVGVVSGGGGSTNSSVAGATSSVSVGGSSTLSVGGALGSGGFLGLGGAGSQTGGSATTGTGGVDCSCVRGAYVPVCGTNGVTYDATCGDSCVPVAIECRHQCPCTSTGGASSVGGSSALAATGGNSSGGTSSTSTAAGGLCGSNCSVNSTVVSICGSSQVLLTCSAPYPSDLADIMTTNGCTDSGLDMIGYCCPTLIQTGCRSRTI